MGNDDTVDRDDVDDTGDREVVFLLTDANLVDRLLAITDFDSDGDGPESSNWLTLTGRGVRDLLFSLMGDSLQLILRSSFFVGVGVGVVGDMLFFKLDVLTLF